MDTNEPPDYVLYKILQKCCIEFGLLQLKYHCNFSNSIFNIFSYNEAYHFKMHEGFTCSFYLLKNDTIIIGLYYYGAEYHSLKHNKKPEVYMIYKSLQKNCENFNIILPEIIEQFKNIKWKS